MEGSAVFYPVFGFIISISIYHNYFVMGMDISLFHCGGDYLDVFFLQYYVYDSPAQHPRIDLSENNIIPKHLVILGKGIKMYSTLKQ